VTGVCVTAGCAGRVTRTQQVPMTRAHKQPEAARNQVVYQPASGAIRLKSRQPQLVRWAQWIWVKVP